MTRTVLRLLAAAVLSGCSTASSEMAEPSSAFPAADEKAVRALVDAFSDSWNRHDMKAMHDLDTEDVNWINVVGHHWRGKDTVYKGHAAIHRGMVAKGSMSVESVMIRPIAPDVAVAVATLHFDATTDPRYPVGPAAKTRGSFTTVKRDGVWKIVHFQNTIIDPKAEDGDPVYWDADGTPRSRPK